MGKQIACRVVLVTENRWICVSFLALLPSPSCSHSHRRKVKQRKLRRSFIDCSLEQGRATFLRSQPWTEAWLPCQHLRSADGHGGAAARGGREKRTFSAVSGSKSRTCLSFQLQLLHRKVHSPHFHGGGGWWWAWATALHGGAPRSAMLAGGTIRGCRPLTSLGPRHPVSSCAHLLTD